MSTTATVSLVKDFLSGQIIFLNSAFRFLNTLFFCLCCFLPCSISLSCRSHQLLGLLMQRVLSCRTCNTSWFPFSQDVSSYPLSCCNSAACIPYMPMLLLHAQLPPPLSFFCNSGQKKRALCFHTLPHLTTNSSDSQYFYTALQSRKRHRSQFHPDRPAGTSISRLCLAWAVDPWRNIDTKWIPTISSGSQVPLETSVSIRKNSLSRLLRLSLLFRYLD